MKPGPSKDMNYDAQLMTAMLASIKAALIATDLAGKIIYWNEFAEELYGWSAADLLNRDLAELLADEGKQLRATLANGVSWTGILKLKGKDGTRFSPLATCSVLSSCDRQPLGMVGIIHDNGSMAQLQSPPPGPLRESRRDLEKRVKERTVELNVANDNLRELSGRLLRMQDDERRRIARELHDSVGQLLAAVSINSASVEAEAAKLSPAAMRALSENAALIAEINKEIRTLSHLLHPPLLDEAGLTSALSWYIRGFSERSKIKVAVDIPPDFVRPPEEMEIAIFRIVQESLTNIHRHSGSVQASVRLAHVGERVVVEIKDAGKGMASKPKMITHREGVGIRGMRERIRQLGGILEIRSDASGTIVEATLPVSPGVAT
ncbi:MAG: histidine kinase [Acidobacteriota bacterium]|nr:histidine kinase [Acidobacteriota bacterium]